MIQKAWKEPVMDQKRDLPGAACGIAPMPNAAPVPDGELQLHSAFSRIPAVLIRLALSLTLCAVMAVVSGCATVQTDTAEEEEEEVEVAEKKVEEPKKVVEKKKAKPRKKATSRRKRVARKPKPAPVAKQSTTAFMAATSQPPESNGWKWLYVAAPIAIASAGLTGFLRRKKRRRDKAPSNLRSAGERPPPKDSGPP